MKFCLSVHIDGAIERLKKGVNIFSCGSQEALSILQKAKEEGKNYYSGCDNMGQDGRCAGHKA